MTRRRRAGRALLIGFAVMGVSACQVTDLEGHQGARCRVVHIGDGDSMTVNCDGRSLEVRLYCIDAPELDQGRWGWASRDQLRRIAPAEVRLRIIDVDRYDRQVVLVEDPKTGAGESLNLALARTGHAAVYRHFCKMQRFYAAEEQARRQGLGIWSRPGKQQRPWDHRHR